MSDPVSGQGSKELWMRKSGKKQLDKRTVVPYNTQDASI
jgi:hypothetical protein